MANKLQNMPVAAREASIIWVLLLLGITLETWDSVALSGAQLLSLGEALREMSGRLEEMPGDEGYPAYLVSRVADFMKELVM